MKKSTILFVVSLIFGLMFINSGLNKIFNYLPVPPDLPENVVREMTALMQVSWLMPLIAIAEILGGILFIIPKTRALGAIITFPIMVGIMLTHIFTAPAGLPFAIVLLGINVWILFENRRKYAPMLQK